MRFDGPTFAHAFLAVFAAAGTDKQVAQLYKKVAIEEHPTGIRFIATDRVMILTAWVPDLDHYYSEPPVFEQAPGRVVVVDDTDARGRGLAGYVCSLANRILPDEYVPGQVPIEVGFDERLPAGTDPQTALEGLDPTFVVLSVPDVEKVYLEVHETRFPDWRPIVDAHQPRRTGKITINAEVAERLAKVRKHAASTIAWSFGGADSTALVEFPDSDPFVHGAVMPVRETDPEPPGDGDEPDEAPGNVVNLHALDNDGAGLVAQAVQMVVTTQFGSPSMLKRKLGITPAKAQRIMEHLETLGIVGPVDGTKARDVLIRPEDLEKVLGRLQETGEDD